MSSFELKSVISRPTKYDLGLLLRYIRKPLVFLKVLTLVSVVVCLLHVRKWQFWLILASSLKIILQNVFVGVLRYKVERVLKDITQILKR